LGRRRHTGSMLRSRRRANDNLRSKLDREGAPQGGGRRPRQDSALIWNWYQTLKKGLLLLCCLMATACSVPNSTIREQFEKNVKAYNRMLRWHEIESAGTYLEPEQRDEFMKAAADIKKREVTITDFRILTSECLPDKGTGEVMAEFDYYILPSNRIKTQNYHQDWVYRDINEHKSWMLKSGLPPFE
jgi:hypothetical protein